MLDASFRAKASFPPDPGWSGVHPTEPFFDRTGKVSLGADSDAALDAPRPWVRQNRGCPRCLQFDLLRDGEGVIHLDPEIANGTLQLRVPKQQLHRSQVAGLLVNLSRLRPAN